MKVLVDIYRSRRKADTYLYVKNGQPPDELPAQLLALLGRLELAMTLALSNDKKLARADIQKVLHELEEKGYYLQLPPSPEAYMQQIPNDKLR